MWLSVTLWPRRPLDDFSPRLFPFHNPKSPTHRGAAESTCNCKPTKSSGAPTPPNQAASETEIQQGREEPGETPSEEEDQQQAGGGGEVVGAGGGCRGICDDNPVEAGGAAARLPDPIPAQVNHPARLHSPETPTGKLCLVCPC